MRGVILIQPATNNPIMIIKIPTIRCTNTPVFPVNNSCAHLPIKVKLNPKLKNMSETPKRKKKACVNNFLRTFISLFVSNSFTLTPVIYDKYIGNIGNVHGFKKDKTPAPTANQSVTSPPIVKTSFRPYFSIQTKDFLLLIQHI